MCVRAYVCTRVHVCVHVCGHEPACLASGRRKWNISAREETMPRTYLAAHLEQHPCAVTAVPGHPGASC